MPTRAADKITFFSRYLGTYYYVLHIGYPYPMGYGRYTYHIQYTVNEAEREQSSQQLWQLAAEQRGSGRYLDLLPSVLPAAVDNNILLKVEVIFTQPTKAYGIIWNPS